MSDLGMGPPPVGAVVTADLLSTRHQSFRLTDIDHVEVSRPLFLATVPIVAGCALIAVRFGDLLTVGELSGLLLVPGLALGAASQVGVLRLHSISVRNEYVWGRYSDIVRVRQQIECVMQSNIRARARVESAEYVKQE